jgi:hypothetical protein
MDFNDAYSDCGFAADDHANITKSGSSALIGTFGQPKFSTLLEAYFAYGIAQGEPGPNPDNGVDNASMFAWLYSQGLIYGYGEVPLDEIDAFVSAGRGVIAGLALDGGVAQQDFNASPRGVWDAMGTSDGHDVLIAKTDGQGGGSIVTWGGLIDFTPAFRRTNITDAWVIFDDDDPLVDHVSLIADLQSVNGTLNQADLGEGPEPIVQNDNFWDKIGHVAEEFKDEAEKLVSDIENVGDKEPEVTETWSDEASSSGESVMGVPDAETVTEPPSGSVVEPEVVPSAATAPIDKNIFAAETQWLQAFETRLRGILSLVLTRTKPDALLAEAKVLIADFEKLL